MMVLCGVCPPRAWWKVGLLVGALLSATTACVFPLPGSRSQDGHLPAPVPSRGEEDEKDAEPEASRSSLPEIALALTDCLEQGLDLDTAENRCVSVDYDPLALDGSWRSRCQCVGNASSAATAAAAAASDATAPKLPWVCWREHVVFEAGSSYRRQLDLYGKGRCEADRRLATVVQKGRFVTGTAAADRSDGDEAGHAAGRKGVFVNYEHGERQLLLVDASLVESWTTGKACGVESWTANVATVMARDACLLSLPVQAFTNGASLAQDTERSLFRREAKTLRLASVGFLLGSKERRYLDVALGAELMLVETP